MPFCKITFTPPPVLRNPPRSLLRTVRRPQLPRPPPLTTIPLTPHRFGRENRAFTSSRIIMASDADYAAFLGKLQKDYSQPSSEAPAVTTKAANAEVPAAIRALGERYYVSDADEPFEGVSFVWEKETLPNEDEFRSLTGAQDGITQLTPSHWDSRGEYADVVRTVAEAVNGRAVKVYRVEGAGSRVEYFILGVDTSGGKLVGFKVLAVES